MNTSHKLLSWALAACMGSCHFLTSGVLAYPGNTLSFDCFRKSDNTFSFGSHSDVSNSAILCTPNPDRVIETPPPPTASSNTGAAAVVTGLGLAVGAAVISDAIRDRDRNRTYIVRPPLARPSYRPGYYPGYRPGYRPPIRPPYRPPLARPPGRPPLSGHRPVRPGRPPLHRPTTIPSYAR